MALLSVKRAIRGLQVQHFSGLLHLQHLSRQVKSLSQSTHNISVHVKLSKKKHGGHESGNN